MRKIVNIIRVLTTIAVAAVLVGCDSGSSMPDGKRAVKEAANELTFVETSDGLPSSGLWRHGLAFYDLNDDGYMDILAPPARKASEDKLPAVWYGNGKGRWTKSRLAVPDIAYDYGSIAVSDLNGDGIADIALAMHGVGLKVLLGTAQGKYMNVTDGIPPATEYLSRILVSDDFDNDGVSDIAAISEAPFEPDFPNPDGMRICKYSDQTLRCSRLSKEDLRGFYADQMVTGDVNKDGNRDIAVASLVSFKPLIIWLGDGKGGFTPFNKGLPQDKVIFYPTVALGDIDGDGRDDLAANITGAGRDASFRLRAFLSRQDGFEEISEGLPPDKQQFYSTVTLADMDGDGNAEIIAATRGGGIKIFSLRENRWNEVSAAGLPDKGLLTPYNLYCLDLNGDGRRDIAVNYASEKDGSGGIRVYLNAPGEGKK